MSNAATGVFGAVTILMELNPMAVYRKATQLVQRHQELVPLVGEVVQSYGQLLDDLSADFATLDGMRP